MLYITEGGLGFHVVSCNENLKCCHDLNFLAKDLS